MEFHVVNTGLELQLNSKTVCIKNSRGGVCQFQSKFVVQYHVLKIPHFSRHFALVLCHFAFSQNKTHFAELK